SWRSFKNAVTGDSTYNPSIAGSGVDTIYYTVTTGVGCDTTIKSPITLNAKPVCNITVAPNLCLDSTLTISSSSVGAVSRWNWNVDNGTTPSFTNSNPFTATYTSLGDKNITLITETAAGCKSDTAKALVTVRPMPVANFTVPASVCMPNGVTNFTNTSTVTPSGSLSYLWNFGDVAGSSISNPNTSTLVNGSHIYPSITNYTVSLTATSFYGCQKTEVKIINPFVIKPNAFAKTLQDTLCQGNPSFFIDSSWSVGSSITGWRWIMGDGSPARTSQNPVHTYASPGNYNVSLIVTNAAGCVSDTFPKKVLVYLQPLIDAGPSFVIQQGDGVLFNPTANDSTTTRFLWTPPIFLNKTDTLRPYYQSAAVSSSSTTTSTTYWLTATGLGRCTATDSLTVKVLGSLIIPNAFSPNNDGINDVWDIPNLRDYPGSTVQIFNRSGQLVFTSTGYNKPWDGKYLGTPLPIGTYYYIINPQNGLKVISGGITILR
ncbi:MAG: PKD domain-containing protein, partial [Chitinophagaceae bacterium]